MYQESRTGLYSLALARPRELKNRTENAVTINKMKQRMLQKTKILKTLRFVISTLQRRSENFDVKSHSLYPGGAGSEVWNRVYMIAPVKKFGRVRLSTNFPSQQIWRRMRTWKDDEFSLGFTFYGVQTSRKGFHELFS